MKLKEAFEIIETRLATGGIDGKRDASELVLFGIGVNVKDESAKVF